MPDDGYMSKGEAMEYVREKTGYGRRVIERVMSELEEAGAIHFYPDPGHLQTRIIHIHDVERIIVALRRPPPPPPPE